MKMDCYAEERLLMRKYDLFFLNAAENCTISQTLLKADWTPRVKVGFRMLSEKYSVTLTWSPTNSNSCSNESSVDGTGRHEKTNNDCSCFRLMNHWYLPLLTFWDLSQKTKQGHQFIIVMTDRHSKLIQAVSVPKTTASNVLVVVLKNWVVPYSILSWRTDSGPQFVSKIFAALCTSIGTNLNTATEYHPQANGQVERFNKTLAARLPHFINKCRANWDVCVQPLTIVYNIYVNRTTNASLFSFVPSWEPAGTLVSAKIISS